MSKKQLMEAIKGNPELVERLLMVCEGAPDSLEITSPDDAYATVAPLIAGKAVEHLAVVAVDRRHRVIASKILTIGNAGSCIVDPKQIYRWALQQGRSGAHAIIIAHNHPSGDPTPSAQDYKVTRRVKNAGEIIGIALLDHIVVGGDTFRRVEV